MIRFILIILLSLPSITYAQFFTGTNQFVQTASTVVPQTGLSDITQTDDGRVFVIADTSKILELDYDDTNFGVVQRSINYTHAINFVDNVTGFVTNVTGNDCEAICWMRSTETEDLFAILHEGRRVVFFVWIPNTGNYTIDLDTIEANGDWVQLPVSNASTAPFEAMRRDAFDSAKLIVTNFTAKTTDPPSTVWEVEIIRDEINPISFTINPHFVLSATSVYYQIRGTCEHPLLVNTFAVRREGNSQLRLAERDTFGNFISVQNYTIIGQPAIEGLTIVRDVDRWHILLVADVNYVVGSTTNKKSFFRFTRLD